MAIPLEQISGTESLGGDNEHLIVDAGGTRVHIQMEAIDGMARDVLEGFKALPRRGVEVGGLLLGRVIPNDTHAGEIWVDRFQRISCHHKFGPQFVLDEEDEAALQTAAAELVEANEVSVLGMYRSHTRPGFALEEADLQLADRYFRDDTDLLLLIKPENFSDLQARFFARVPQKDEVDTCRLGETQEFGNAPAIHAAEGSSATGWSPAGEAFAFQGRIVGGFGGGFSPADPEPVPERTSGGVHDSPPASEPAVPRMRRLIPDFSPTFVPSGDTPNPRPVFQAPVFGAGARKDELDGEGNVPALLRKWWPLFGALVLVGGAVGIQFYPSASKTGGASVDGASIDGAPSTGEAAAAAAVRPLGLFADPVDPNGSVWRVTWNQNATSLGGAKAVNLFVRDGDDQNRIDLSPNDLKAGAYQYRSKGSDVTFRLEVTDASGRATAESFRSVRRPGANIAAAKAPVASLPATPSKEPRPAVTPKTSAGKLTPPKATKRVPPVVPASIRPRIHGSVPIDVRVKIDAHGRVTAATPVARHTGLQAYLAERAVAAARQWRFTPARQDGLPVAGTQTIHFAFDR